jgi:hypothetical protein
MDAADRELFEATLRRATADHSGAALDAALDGLGWRDALGTDAPAAVSLLFELQGAANTTSSALTHVLGGALGLDIHRAAPLVLPPLGTWHPPGRIADGALQVRGLGLGSLARHGRALVPATRDGDTVLVEVRTADLERRAVRGLDPRLDMVEVGGTPALFENVVEVAPGGWPAAVAQAHLALAHEQVGASRTMLELARTHALGRVQFGQAISGFQAVRHRLAETLIAIETAQALLGSAWLDPTTDAAAMAKSLAGRGAKVAARHCQQVLAGIGFTTEHDLHHFVRRAFVLDLLFGTAQTLTTDLGTRLLASRRLTALPPL